MEHIYVLVLAGGSGTRFWPRSRENKPKHFLSVCGHRTLIQDTVDRFLQITSRDNIYILSKVSQSEEIRRQKLNISPQNILFEPVGRNTLPSIGLGLMYIQERDPNACIVVTPADHLVENQSLFRESIFTACNIAKDNKAIVTIGIRPTFPAVGYGYISTEKEIQSCLGVKVFKIKKFVEKPDLKIASQYYSAGNHYWNSGLFVFKGSVLWEEIGVHAPDIYESLTEIGRNLFLYGSPEEAARIYYEIRSESIDNAIMEKSDNTYVVEGNFLWKDLGSWSQVYELAAKDEFNNAIVGDAVFEDTENSYIYSTSGLIALIGVKNLFVIQDRNVTLICSKDRSEDVKKMVTRLKVSGLEKYV